MPPKKPGSGAGPGQGAGQQIPLDQQSGPVEMPQSALDRLKSMRGASGERRLFTSDLSTNEFLLIKEAGFDPVGMVVGSSIYHVGYQPIYGSGLLGTWGGYGSGGYGYGYAYEDQELNVLTQAKYNARELAMSRMEAEAQALDADGIVGVRLDAGEYEWGPDLVEFIAVGTAVRARDDGASFRTRFGKPFTSDLSGQDLRTLLGAGYRPLGLVMGTCVYASYQNGWEFQRLAGWSWGGSMTWGLGGFNGELDRFTQAIYTARDLAMGRMQSEARSLGAEGVVGVHIEVKPDLSRSDSEFMSEVNEARMNPGQVWRTFNVDIFAVGTAVAPLRADHQIAPPRMAVNLKP
jgi:uncharacterized protein YbjQ (UPF0145 family)